MESKSPPPSGGQKTMLTCAELARRWGLDIKTVYEGIKLGQIPVVRLSRKVIRIAIATVEQIERQGRVEPEGVSHAGKTR